MNPKKLVLVLPLFLTVAACGPSRPGNIHAYQSGSDKCSSTVIDSYKVVRLTAEAVRNAKGAEELAAAIDELESELDQFATQFKDVRCKAVYRSTSDDEGELDSFDVNETVEDLRAGIRSARRALEPFPFPGNREAYIGRSQLCSGGFFSDYNGLLAGFEADLAAKRFEAAEAKISDFEAKFRDVECQGEFQDENDSTKWELEVLKVNEAIADLRAEVKSARENQESGT